MEKYLIIIQKYLRKLDTEVEKFIRSGKYIRFLMLMAVIVVIIIVSAIKDIVSSGTYGSLSYGGKTYKTVVIGTQTWMAENLNYETRWSKCYDNQFQNCYKYGRLYNWYTAKKICPEGWRLPANNEWENLINKKSSEKFGFAPLLGGIGAPYPTGDSTIGAKYYNIDHSGYWWTSTDYDMENAIARNMYTNEERINWGSFDKLGLFSVRCIKNESR